MKKWAILFMSMALTFSLVACGSDSGNGQGNLDSAQAEVSETATETASAPVSEESKEVSDVPGTGNGETGKTLIAYLPYGYSAS